MAKWIGSIAAAVVVLGLSGYAAYRVAGTHVTGAPVARALHRLVFDRDVATDGSGRHDALVTHSTGIGARALDDQPDECADDDTAPPSCND